MREKYLARYILRVFVLLTALVSYITDANIYGILKPNGFFQAFSPIHLLWLVWISDMITKIFPRGSMLSMGALKHIQRYYRENPLPVSKERLRQHTKRNNRRALPILLIWTVLSFVLALLAKLHILERKELFLISVFFYVCDLICVLFWCPFRIFFMHNRCCTTCRIFNWDHIMMTSPLFALNSFYSWSLIGASLIVFFLWEYRNFRYPQRFYEGCNSALQCKNCTDLLCGQRRDKSVRK